MRFIRFIRNPYAGLVWNIIYAVGNVALGVFGGSWWFVTLGVYYVVLAVARFSVLRIRRKAKGNYDVELLAKQLTGILLMVLSFCITGVNVLSILEGRGTAFHEIVMIAIATYTFTKITVAIIEMAKARHTASPVIKTLRNLSLANACVSVHSMQRSMLVSFPGMEMAHIQLFNILTGTAVWIIVLLLGINLIGGKYTIVAKSKIVEANEKIAKVVTVGYKKIEKGVVDGYKKIEQGVVGGYTKIEDRFVAAYLAKEGETVEEAKERLKNEKHH